MVRKRGLEQFSNDFHASDANGLQHENHSHRISQHSLKERFVLHSNESVQPIEAQDQPRHNLEKSAKFTQELHKDYTSTEDCDHLKDATIPDDLLDVVTAWLTLPTKIRDCIHALAMAIMKDT